MTNKNKQYKIEKGLLLFTQPRSPYFYGKIRIIGKYRTQSFAPISDINTAKERLYEWRDEIITAPLRIEDSCVVLPEGPGWGIELDMDGVERHRWRPGDPR